MNLVKKVKARKNMTPDPDVLEGIAKHNPHEEFANKDAAIKKRRGGTK